MECVRAAVTNAVYTGSIHFYLTFYKASLLLFVAAITTASYASLKSQKT